MDGTSKARHRQPLLLACRPTNAKVTERFIAKPSIPNLSHLSGTWNALLELPHVSTKFCFFIDGLDEYSGDEEETLRLMLDISSSSNIKICVSSRPWNTFLDAFETTDGS
jgi:hypothetical protein